MLSPFSEVCLHTTKHYKLCPSLSIWYNLSDQSSHGHHFFIVFQLDHMVFPEMLNNTPVPFAFNSSPGVSYLWIRLSSLATREYKWAGESDHLTSRCTCQEGNPTLCLSDINNPSRFPNRASEACCPRNETQPAGIRWALQNVLLQCPLRLLQCASPRQQKPKGILAWLEKVISFYVMTLQSNCAQNNCFYCLNTFLVLEHPGGFNCACNFADINEGD